MNRLRSAAVLAALGLVLLGYTPARANPADPEFLARSAENHARAHGRTLDQLANPAFLLRYSEQMDRCVETMTDLCAWTDPYRAEWGGDRGTSVPIEYRNRYEARISGHLWLPPLPSPGPHTGRAAGGPFPAVIIVNGSGAAEQPYWGTAQGLAERGYVVMTFDPQGQGSSDVQPAPRFCDPDGDWRKPQEIGVREHGECAGMAPADPPLELALVGAGCFVDGCEGPELDASYDRHESRFVLGALDAVRWLLSPQNPRRSLVDARRVGIAGHSMGARAAEMVANGDPLRRFRAAVSWDSGSGLPARVPPRVPTMFQIADSEEAGGPYLRAPEAGGRAGSRTAARFAHGRVDTAVVGLRGSTHQEWSFTPPYGVAMAKQFVASSLGERVALYYTAGWFDRYLKGAPGPGSRDHRADARRRLLASVFDGSVDASSIGQGRWDPVSGENAPYRIGGLSVGEHLSIYHRSWAVLDGLACPDLRAGCPGRTR